LEFEDDLPDYIDRLERICEDPIEMFLEKERARIAYEDAHPYAMFLLTPEDVYEDPDAEVVLWELQNQPDDDRDPITRPYDQHGGSDHDDLCRYCGAPWHGSYERCPELGPELERDQRWNATNEDLPF
jgi:hypothetical protein